MKTIYDYLLLMMGFFFPMLLNGCDAEKKLRIVETGDAALYKQIYILGYGAENNFESNQAIPMEKTSNPNIFTYQAKLRYYDDNKQFKFCTAQGNWNEIYYIIPSAGVVGGKSYAYTTYGEDAPNSARLCSELTGDLDDHFWGIREGEDGIYDITLNVKEMTVTVVLVEKLDEEEFELNQLFIIGDATPSGWDINNPYPMEMISTNVFQYEGPLRLGEMKCPINNNGKFEDEFLMPLVAGTVINKSGVADPAVEYVPTGNPDSKWKIEYPGNYRIIIDASGGKKNITISVTWLSDLELEPELYMLGNASGKWYSTDGFCMDSADGNIFTWEGEINYNTENKQFKFCTAKGEWDQVEFLVPENATADGYIEVIQPGTYKLQRCSQSEGTLKDAFFGIPEDGSGVYKISVNVETLTVTLEKVQGIDEPEITELYMLGVAGNSGTDSNHPGVQLTYDETSGRFSWEGELYYTENEGNRQFNFITSKGDWDQVTFLIPEKGDSDGYRELVEDNGVYKIKKVRGAGNPLSASWGISQENSGKYRIEVDAEDMTLYVFKAE
ncbi:SusF/SusE family outer membrane protein [uncultured Bacteroides sp.]|uniref:SusF/SusE family outer membrane protein n=1 Tax=uncultured Bacteroides sp. TaxID=162156 RepID=UPI002676B8BB|nr:SusF/SusE family outer membrane protein [uncultured Bacteroides sp.]